MENIISLIYDMCRICLDKPGCVNIFSKVDLSNDILTFTGVIVTEKDNLPSSICDSCSKALKVCKKLRQQAIDSEIRLKSFSCNDYRKKNDPPPDIHMEPEVVVSETNVPEQIEESTTTTASVFFEQEREIIETQQDPEHSEVSSSNINSIESASEEDTHSRRKKRKKKEKGLAVRTDLFPVGSMGNMSEPEVDMSLSPESPKLVIDETPRKNIKKHQTTCDICGKEFARWKNLYLHLRLHNKSHPCPICFKGFAARGDLTKHVRVHTGEKPFKCDICDKQFAQKVTLKAHKETVHAD